MHMKTHILAALREQFTRWDELLLSLSEGGRVEPQSAEGWSIKDYLAHLNAWQQRSIARLQAVLLDREPDFPHWLAELDPELVENTDAINAWIYETTRSKTWLEIYHQWREGYLMFMDCAEGITERDLLDGGKYPWMEGRPIALVLLASYDHHQEHYDQLQTWLWESQRKTK